MSGKFLFAPYPPRAIGDQRLTCLHFRVLGAIALHDRMSSGRKYGQGCWAGNKTLAQECGCHYASLSTAITDLARWDYILRTHHPLNKRRKVYRVIYNEADRPVVQRRKSLPADKLSVASPNVVVCPDLDNPIQNQGLKRVEYIPLKREEKSEVEKAHVDERSLFTTEKAAHQIAPSVNGVGAKLAAFELALRSGRKIHNLAACADFLADIYVSGDICDPNVQQAGELLSEIEQHLATQ
jgi:DNA-binding MarR family transcriptional regulator